MATCSATQLRGLCPHGPWGSAESPTLSAGQVDFEPPPWSLSPVSRTLPGLGTALSLAWGALP